MNYFMFFTAELDNMSSTERISFLQKKLQEIRKYYMSLKSEVASIDRRRKRLKKKEREGIFVYLIYNVVVVFVTITTHIILLIIIPFYPINEISVITL